MHKMRLGIPILLLVAWLGLGLGRAQGALPVDDPFDYPEMIIRAEGAREMAVMSANVDEAALAGRPLRVIVRFPRGAKLDEAVARLMALPPSQLAGSVSSAGHRSPGDGDSDGGGGGVREVKRLRGGAVRGVVLELPAGTHAGGALASLRALPDVVDAEIEGLVTVQGGPGTVEALGGAAEVQPGLLRTGLARPSPATPGGALVQPTAAPGASVAVAVVDTGVDRAHPDLNVVGGVDFTPDNDYGLDGNGHGTHVAGVVGAKNNGVGTVGALPGAPLWSLKVLSAAGQGSTSDVVEALNWAADNGRDKGIRVVNLSLSGPKSRIMCDAIRAVVSRGITVVAAAGNNGLEIGSGSPADCVHALVVTAIADYDGKPGGLRQPPGGPGAPTTRDDAPAGFSNYAAARTSRVVAAPGVHVLSTVPAARCAALRCTRAGAYAHLSGTSMAAPLVSGMAAICYNDGRCAAPRASSASVLTDAFAAAARDDKARGFAGDPSSSAPGRYYGYLATAL